MDPSWTSSPRNCSHWELPKRQQLLTHWHMVTSRNSEISSKAAWRSYRSETLCPTLRWEHAVRVFGDRVPRKTSAPQRKEVTCGWKKIASRAYWFTLIFQVLLGVMKWSRLIWMGHGLRMGEDKCVAEVWRGNLKENYYFEDLAIYWRIILK